MATALMSRQAITRLAARRTAATLRGGPSTTTGHASFSTSRPARRPSNTNSGNGNPSMPTVSLKSLVPNARLRYALIGLLGVAACAETVTWIYIWPRLSGADENESEKDGSSS